MKETTVHDLPQNDLLIISRKGIYDIAQSILTAIKSYCRDYPDAVDDTNDAPTQEIDTAQQLLTANEVIKRLKISYPTLWRYGKPNMQSTQYYLPAKKINGRLMYQASDVDRIYAIRIGNKINKIL